MIKELEETIAGTYHITVKSSGRERSFCIRGSACTGALHRNDYSQ